MTLDRVAILAAAALALGLPVRAADESAPLVLTGTQAAYSLTVACVKIVGAVLVEALLLIPAAAARDLNRSIRGFVWWSIAFSTAACLVGIYAPMRWDLPLPSGGAIILAAALIFVATMIVRMALPRYRQASV